MRVNDVEVAVQHNKDDMQHAKITGLTIKEPKQTFEEMNVALRDSLSDIASSDNGQDGEHEDDQETEQSKLSEDDEPGWVMGTVTKTSKQCMERFQQRQKKLDGLTQL